MGGKQIVSPGAIEQLNNNLTTKANAVINAHSTYGTDANAYTTTGMYGIEGVTNGPSGYQYGTLSVTRYSDANHVTQIWQSVLGENIFIRHRLGGTWSSWEELALRSSLNSKSNILSVSTIDAIPGSSGSMADYTKSAARTDYTPIAIVGMQALTSFSCISTIENWYLDGTTIRYRCNPASNTAGIRFHILYVKT